MSMKDLLGSECGQLNPVLKVASHFAGSGSSAGNGAPIGPAQLVGRSNQNFANPLNDGRPLEHLLPPTTFRMDSLLNEIQSLDRSHGPAQAPRVVDLTNNEEWVQELLNSESSLHHGTENKWADEYGTNGALDFDRAWEDPNLFHHPIYRPNMQHHPTTHPVLTNSSVVDAKDLLEDSKWTNEYVLQDKTELMATAEEFLSSITDPSIRATEFMTYVEKLSTGETTIEQKPEEAAVRWAGEYESEISAVDDMWANSYTNPIVGDSESMTSNERQEFWENLQSQWEKAGGESGLHPWLHDASQHVHQPYSFEDENPFKEFDDPFEEGKRRLLASDIPAAALLFEAAVQKDSANVDAWYLLGTTQALNEQDPQAISALNKCLELQPDNAKASMALAASLTNESYNLQACRILKTWLKQHLKYSDLIPGEIEKPSATSSILPNNELATVQNLFIKAARRSPAHDLDPDVQCGLGVLFNISSDYEKAGDCFQSAITADPENALLWNRLGATLANGGKSAEAIGAYSRALEIIPGFIRTRYNIGIACINLGSYREAAEHFLSALNLQAASKSTVSRGDVKNTMSNSIWTSLRMVLHLLDKGTLSHAIDTRDLNVLNREFGISS